jgi:orotidine-5'-phosphate decarboxylase
LAGLIAALDTADLATAQRWAEMVAPHCGLLKLGLEFFCAHGPQGVRSLSRHRPIFLDLKFCDIPNTVAGAVRAVLPLAPAMVTLHAGGGAAMIAAARRELDQAGDDRPRLLAITVLTSFDEATLHAAGVTGTVSEQVLRLARLALDSGADGLVCAPAEVAMLRSAFGPKPILVVPGVRPAGNAADDQRRVATPAEAARDGADWVVVGRPITQSPDPAKEAARLAAEARS